MKTIDSAIESIIQRVHLQTRRFVLPALVAVGVWAGAGLAQGDETVPYKSRVSGHLTFTPSGGFKIEESGIGTHLGNFTLIGETDATGILWFTLTVASGDQLLGVMVDAAPDLSWVELVIYDGTGRFEGDTGNITGIVAMDWSTLSYTAVGSGSMTTVGSNKK